MIKKLLLIIIILFTCFPSCFGQREFRDGFLITNDNDTIRGQVDYRSNAKNYESCIFKSEEDAKDHEYFPNQIKGFGYIDDKFFSSQIIDGTFVEVLIRGKINLYKSKDKFHVQKDTSFFDLESITEEVEVDGKIGTRETSRWRGTLAYLISDCLENLAGLTANVKLDEKSLTRLVVKYNKCKGTEFTEFKASKPWTQFDFGVTLGLSKTEITSDVSRLFAYLDNSYNSVDPSVGVVIAISSPRISEKMAFQGELHYLKSNYSSLVELRSPTEYHDTFIELTTLSIPISLKYSFPEKKYGLYLQGGFNFDYHINSDTRLLSEQVNGDVVKTFPERPAFEVKNNQIGYWGGLGILKSYQKFRWSVAIRYFQLGKLNKNSGFTVNNDRISLNLILFKK